VYKLIRNALGDAYHMELVTRNVATQVKAPPISKDAERQALAEAWRENGLVFASSIGTPVEPRNVNRRWDDLRRKAGLPWLRLHDLPGWDTTANEPR
jgi:hypothetical protein